MNFNVNTKRLPSGSSISKAIGAIMLIGGAGYLATHSLYNVPGGHRAIEYSRVSGVKPIVVPEGTHFILPWLERYTLFDVRTKPRNISSVSGSRDLQMVNITLRVLYRPVTTALPHIFRTLGTDYDERVLPSIVNEVLKSVIAQFNASQLITQREQVSMLIRRNLVDRAKDFNIQLDDVSITHIAFGKDYSAAVEAKQVAQQEAERAKYIVDKALQDKRSVIVSAQGEAQAARLIGQAMRENSGYLELRRIQIAKDIAKVIASSENKVYLNSDALLLTLQDALNNSDLAKTNVRKVAALDVAPASDDETPPAEAV